MNDLERHEVSAFHAGMESARIPLIIGIAGHRELQRDDADRLKGQVRRELEQLRSDYPSTPIILLSSLGPGADCLAAEIAVEGVEGVELGAVLPWPEGVCDHHLHRRGDQQVFEKLLKMASRRIYLPLPEGMARDAVSESEDARQTCYAEASRYITHHSQIMLAIWNGIERTDSQTWQVIRWHMEGTPAPFAAAIGYLDEPETGPLIHLPVRREGDSDSPASTERSERTLASAANSFRNSAKSIDEFNADLARHSGAIATSCGKAKGYVIPDTEQRTLASHEAFVLDRYSVADQLSILFQKKSGVLIRNVLVLILVTVASFEVYAHMVPGNWMVLLAYPLFFALGVIMVRRSRRKRIYNRFIDYRALAEAMRVHLFWKIAGRTECTSDYYLRSCRSRLDWIRVAIRAWTVQSGEHDSRSISGPGGDLDKVKKFWIDEQCKYFEESSTRDEEHSSKWKRLARVFLFASIGVAAIQIGRLYLGGDGEHPLGADHLTHYLIVAIAMGGVAAGLCHEYAEKHLFEKQSRSYKWMSSLFATASKRMTELIKNRDVAAAQELVLELGREALAENSDWVIYHREHEPEMKSH